MNETAALEAGSVGKRYGANWALRDCTLSIPVGSVTALVGPNGAGKTTLLQLAVGLIAPAAGTIRVLGHDPRAEPLAVLPRVGFVAQDHPLPRRFTIAETLRLGRELNQSWDNALAERRVDELGLPRRQRVGTLSGGQRAQVALTLALAKRPQLLLLDEPVASLDPLARREFLTGVLGAVTETGITVVLSSHIVADLERICDRLIILAGGRTQLVGPIEDILAGHRLLTGPRTDAAAVSRVHQVIRERHTERQTTLLVRASGHVYDACWEQHEVDLEEIVLAYLGMTGASARVEAAAVAAG
jgi:ABC-2 type transport system ATP-binding protein